MFYVNLIVNILTNTYFAHKRGILCIYFELLYRNEYMGNFDNHMSYENRIWWLLDTIFTWMNNRICLAHNCQYTVYIYLLKTCSLPCLVKYVTRIKRTKILFLYDENFRLKDLRIMSKLCIVDTMKNRCGQINAVKFLI